MYKYTPSYPWQFHNVYYYHLVHDPNERTQAKRIVNIDIIEVKQFIVDYRCTKNKLCIADCFTLNV